MFWDREENYDCRVMVTSTVQFVVDCTKITSGKISSNICPRENIPAEIFCAREENYDC